jgi:hypothetical protein
MAQPAKQTVAEQEPQPFVVPAGLQIEHKLGPVTGNHMYKVAGFEMPYEGTVEGAVKLYERLKHAYETGYFVGNGNRAK